MSARGGTGTAVVQADLQLCQGYANCVVAADDVFDLDDDGVVVLLRAQIPGPARERVHEAVRAGSSAPRWPRPRAAWGSRTSPSSTRSRSR